MLLTLIQRDALQGVRRELRPVGCLCQSVAIELSTQRRKHTVSSASEFCLKVLTPSWAPVEVIRCRLVVVGPEFKDVDKQGVCLLICLIQTQRIKENPIYNHLHLREKASRLYNVPQSCLAVNFALSPQDAAIRHHCPDLRPLGSLRRRLRPYPQTNHSTTIFTSSSSGSLRRVLRPCLGGFRSWHR